MPAEAPGLGFADIHQILAGDQSADIGLRTFQQQRIADLQFGAVILFGEIAAPAVHGYGVDAVALRQCCFLQTLPDQMRIRE